MKEIVDKLFTEQLKVFGLAKENYKALETVTIKKVLINGIELTLHNNPKRIISTSAKLDKKSLAERPCFLCDKNLPKEQEGILLSDNFILLLNPFPILQKHFTIVNRKHTPQILSPYLSDLLDFSKRMGEEYTLFYNGAKCGASAPDHMHFQAGTSHQFPIWNYLNKHRKNILWSSKDTQISTFEQYANGVVISGNTKEELLTMLSKVIDILSNIQKHEQEPMMNVLAKYDNCWNIVIFPREQHRPRQYFDTKQPLLLSPASVDFGGLLAVPRKEDFERIDADLLEDVFSQLRLNSKDFEILKNKIKEF